MGDGRKNKKIVIREWDEWYADAKAYHEEHGDLLIRSDFVTTGGYRLGRWIERQRLRYSGKKSTYRPMTEDEIRKLNRIGMVWKLEYRFPWEEWIAKCRQYQMEHGDLLVPTDYVQGNFWLGNWIKEQRKRFAKGNLDEDKVKDLEDCGMVWSVRRC